ncbi:MAG: hypothetical protein HYZ75_14370 [Elusimicrobia bacterium]|nr:hypothetical protein [Elusimicrobiota bacterium]
MKEATARLFAVLLAVAVPCGAEQPLTADAEVSSAALTVPIPAPTKLRLGLQEPGAPGQRPGIGVGVGLSEGKPLQMLTWGSGGAVVGSLAGPLGAAVGGGVGVLVGLAISVFTSPSGPVDGQRGR